MRLTLPLNLEETVFFGGDRIAGNGDPAVGVPGETYQMDSPDMPAPFSVGGSGAYAFATTLSGGGSADSAAFVSFGGTLALAAHAGQPAPGVSAPFAGPYSEDPLGFAPVGISPTGTVAFDARYTTQNTQPGSYPEADGLFRVSSGGALTKLMAAGDPLPSAAGPNDTVSTFYDPVHAPDVNANGDVALLVQAAPSASFAEVLVQGSGQIVQIAHEQGAAPGGGVFSKLPGQPSLDDRGDVAFMARLRDSNSSTMDSGDGVFISSGGSVSAVARTGQMDPSGDATFQSFTAATDPSGANNPTFASVVPDKPNLNSAGQLAFFGQVVTTGTGTSLVGLYVFDGSALHKVVRLGDSLQGKTVSGIGFQTVASPGVRGLNDQCQIAFATAYGDGSYGLWLKNGCSP